MNQTIFALSCFLAWNIQAGGSGLNAVVVVNQNSPNSIELGNYFCERRQVPPEHVLRINWTGGNVSWTNSDFQNFLLDPLLEMLASRQLTSQVDYVVLSMDIPFQTLNGAVVNGTTSALFYGLKTDSGANNSYAASEGIFRQSPPSAATGYSFLATMLTAGSLAQAKRMVDQGVAGDGTFPTQPVVLAKSADPLRNARYRFFDNAIFNARLSPAGNYVIIRTNADVPSVPGGMLGMQTGLAAFSIAPDSFVPGAMADHMTSFGGVIFGGGQTTALALIHAGASGSYGTVTEPQPVTDKFPNPQNYFYQSRGFSLAECYYLSLNVPFQGLVVGEPLAAPCRRPGTGAWMGLSSNAVLSGTAQLNVSFSAADREHPFQQVDLFVDGKFHRTITNIPPQPGNSISLKLNNRTLSYTVPSNPSIASVTSDLSALISSPANRLATQIAATNFGDRIELQSLWSTALLPPRNLRLAATAPAGTPAFTISNSAPLLAASAIGTAARLSTFVRPARDRFLATSATGIRGYTLNGTLQIGTWLQIAVTKTNGARIVLGLTNQVLNTTAYTMASNLVNLVNAAPQLQGPDGIEADDYAQGFVGTAHFNLRARTPGLGAAAVKAQVTSSGSLVVNPAAETDLTQNLSDLEPRNHIYVTAGTTNLATGFALDTTALPEGFHELTAVAYEGSHVRTQTRISIPIRIQNSGLAATLALTDLVDPSPVGGTYHIQVAANTSDVRAINLYSTGGLLSSVTDQSSATFTVTGSSLGIGLHPFWAVVETSTGSQYRTETRRVRLVSAL